MTTIILGTCRYCSLPLEQNLKGRNKEFCDGRCRELWRQEQRQERQEHDDD